MRRHRKIMEVLGEQHFKIHTLNFNAFILKDQSGRALEYILGKAKRPSPQPSQNA